MISWIQRTFQQHFKTVFAVLLGLIIISFVFTIGAAPGIGRADRATLKREFSVTTWAPPSTNNVSWVTRV